METILTGIIIVLFGLFLGVIAGVLSPLFKWAGIYVKRSAYLRPLVMAIKKLGKLSNYLSYSVYAIPVFFLLFAILSAPIWLPMIIFDKLFPSSRTDDSDQECSRPMPYFWLR